jgi:energy-coupling factor transporter ATP-binding protein EcfA2
MAANMPSRLKISQFAHIEDIDLELGDLTVLVGPQGSGKSLALQLFKLGHDRYEVVSALRDAAEAFDDSSRFLDLYLGRGMGRGLRADTVIEVDRKPVRIERIARTRRSADIGEVFYIPAQRALLLADGYPVPFKRLTQDTPTVARLFSETLFKLFGARRTDGALFPVKRELKIDYRDAITDAVYHGGEVRIDEVEGRYRLSLAFDNKTTLPFMTWTAGQREFTPLLFGLYHLLPPRRHTEAEGIEWVVIEEPEMGLHPQALSVVLLLVLELLSRGYRVIISTHATLVLDVVFTLRTLGEQVRRAPASLFEAFGIRKYPETQRVLDAALRCTYKTYLFELVKRSEKDYRVISKDISALDPSSDSKPEAEWGGLTGFSSRFNRVLLSD